RPAAHSPHTAPTGSGSAAPDAESAERAPPRGAAPALPVPPTGAGALGGAARRERDGTPRAPGTGLGTLRAPGTELTRHRARNAPGTGRPRRENLDQKIWGKVSGSFAIRLVPVC
ncbi:hypothetical protein DV515_00016304, partial [Chloebia gouldiae]